MNLFIKKATGYYENFQVYKLMKESSIILDNLSNWYVRRNRRRFWKSENDNDKNAAYLTLHNTLITYIKVMAPVIPFITEEIYSNIKNHEDCESIHLSSFPKYDKNKTNFNLIKEIDDVISIVNLSRSLRNKANIKIRQPLPSIYIYSDQKVIRSIEKNKDQIKDELNIKDIQIVNKITDILDYKIKPNFSLLSSKHGKNMGKIVSLINKEDHNKLVVEIKKNKEFNINLNGKNIQVLDEEILIEEIAKNDLYINSNREITVGLDIKINEELEMEGIVRDLIRHVQDFRKKSNLEIHDRILFSILCSKKVLNSIEKFKNYFANETLTSLIMDDFENMTYRTEFNLNQENIKIGISKIEKE